LKSKVSNAFLKIWEVWTRDSQCNFLYNWITQYLISQSQWHEMSLPTWTLGSCVRILLEAWMFVCVYSVFVLSCVSSGLATGWSLVQGVLPIVYNCKIMEPRKRRPRPDMGCKRLWMDGISYFWLNSIL
jgi:hypothetical protein